MVNHFSNRFPYTDIHELNLDWLIRRMRELEIDMDEFKVVNNITFSGQWDITKQYPAWTIVSDNNIGYVSIQPVPAGVLLTNGDYWRAIIDYTAQIAGLQQRVVDIENDLSNNIHPAINTINNTLNTIDYVDDFNKHNYIIVISDSYGMNIQENFLYFLKQYWGDDMYSSAVSGSSMRQSTQYPNVKNFLRQLTETIEPELETDGIDKRLIKHIVIAGGYNDAHSGTNPSSILAWRTAAREFYTYAHANYPNAKISLAYFGWQLYNNNTYYPLADPLSGRNLYQAYGMLEGFNYLTNSECCLLFDGCIDPSDPFHPTRTGALEESKFLFQSLKSGSYEVKKYDNALANFFTPDNTLWNSNYSIKNVVLEQHNSMMRLMTYEHINNIVLRADTPISVAAINELKLGDIPVDKCAFNIINNYAPTTVTVLDSASNILYKGPASLHIDVNREFKITFNGTAINNISSLFIQSFEFEYDTLMLH